MTDEQNNSTDAAAAQEQQNAPQFAVQRIYVKDISFEAPNLPELFNVEFAPQVKMEMNTKSRQVADDHFEVVMTVTLSAEVEERVAFLAEVQQAGLFLIRGFNEQQTHQLLGAAAPEAIYPYVREAIANLVGRTGFPAIQLAPVNFMGLYMERMQQAAAQAQAAAEQGAGSETIQ